MLPRYNALAPHLTGQLSPKAIQEIQARQAAGVLSPLACKNSEVIRRNEKLNDEGTVLRPSFVRDIEKIMHMPLYNRLNGKTQVFSFTPNEDLTRRGLHVQLVARVARDIGRALGLNLDLIEAIGLGHDIGHTPFGHAGERYLNAVFHERTGRWFFHNVQSVRALDVIYGRNLSLQTLDGVICHNGEFEQQVFEMSELTSFDRFDAEVASCWQAGNAAIAKLRPMTLEGCVMRVSDIIAYVGKDRQDAIRAGLCSEDSFADGLGGAYNSWALAAFVADVVENSLGKDRIEMSEEGFLELRRAKRENYEKIYGSSEINSDFSHEIGVLFAQVYEHELEMLKKGDEEAAIFRHHIFPVQENLARYDRSYVWEDDLDLTVVDFISAMTDDYFIQTAEALFPEAQEIFPHRVHFTNSHA